MKPVNTEDFKITGEFKIGAMPTTADIAPSEIKIDKALKKLSKKL